MERDIREGMVVKSSDGEKLGKVVRCDPDGFLIEKGLFFPKDHFARYDQIARVDADEVLLAVTARSFEAAPATSGESLGSAPRAGGLGLGAGTEEELRVPLAEEELVAEKRTRQAGEVRIRKDVVTERREIPVEVTREEVHVERTPVEGGEARGGEARFEGGTISVPVHEEEVEIRKRPGRPRGDPRRQDGAPGGAAGRRRGPAGDGGDREGGGRRVPRAREARGPARLAGAGRPRAGPRRAGGVRPPGYSVAAMTTLVLGAVAAAAAGAAVGAALALLVLPGRVAAAVRAALSDRLDAGERALERVERGVREESGAGREASAAAAARLRDELRAAQRDGAEATARGLGLFGERLDALARGLEQRLGALGDATEKRLDALRATVDERLVAVQEESARRLEQMRQTVDEKLQGTLERRLADSFKLVSERLEAVQRGLGEMQTLAAGVGDLKKVLTNVKTRGTWGEVQLGALLEQMLAPGQWVANAAPRREGGERVEFAVRLPGPEDGEGEVLLPIDAKFPVEDYQRLVEASERGDAEGVEAASRALEVRIKACARDIHDKYLAPPRTTDFGILFLPTEGLYAEVVRRPGLAQQLQRDQKVMVAGPTTLAALLNSLQMGFRTLAIQKRSSEVWKVLGAVKVEFGRFGEVLEKVEKKLSEASAQLESVGVRNRAIEKRLRGVEALPAPEAQRVLADLAPAEAVDEAEAV